MGSELSCKCDCDLEDIPRIVEDLPHIVEDLSHIVEDLSRIVEDLPHIVCGEGVTWVHLRTMIVEFAKTPNKTQVAKDFLRYCVEKGGDVIIPNCAKDLLTEMGYDSGEVTKKISSIIIDKGIDFVLLQCCIVSL
jgi:hypothetical protein